MIIEHRTKEAIIRSKSLWYNEGEKNTKYFLNLEKKNNCKQGTITQLKVNNDREEFVYSDKEILNDVCLFMEINTAPKSIMKTQKRIAFSHNQI